jgi:hypothetical protein
VIVNSAGELFTHTTHCFIPPDVQNIESSSFYTCKVQMTYMCGFSTLKDVSKGLILAAKKSLFSENLTIYCINGDRGMNILKAMYHRKMAERYDALVRQENNDIEEIIKEN